MTKVYHKSNKHDWGTPQYLFDWVSDMVGGFHLDAAALPHNAKCKRYITPEQDALTCEWVGRNVWLNPPYGRGIGDWLAKAHAESIRRPDRIICVLVPVRTDTRWYHTHVHGKAYKVIFLKGRIKFDGAYNGAPFPSMLVIYSQPTDGTCPTLYQTDAPPTT